MEAGRRGCPWLPPAGLRSHSVRWATSRVDRRPTYRLRRARTTRQRTPEEQSRPRRRARVGRPGDGHPTVAQGSTWRSNADTTELRRRSGGSSSSSRPGYSWISSPPFSVVTMGSCRGPQEGCEGQRDTSTSGPERRPTGCLAMLRGYLTFITERIHIHTYQFSFQSRAFEDFTCREDPLAGRRLRSARHRHRSSSPQIHLPAPGRGGRWCEPVARSVPGAPRRGC